MKTITIEYNLFGVPYTATTTVDDTEPCKNDEIVTLYTDYSSDGSISHFVFEYHGHKFRIMKDRESKVGGHILSIMTPDGTWEKLYSCPFDMQRNLNKLLNYVKIIY